jgi:hypothetical protein
MIRSLRRRHSVLIALVFIVLVIATVIALTRRSPDPVMDALPPAVIAR